MAVEEVFINKEISWLAFNERVLQEAEDRRNLLGDRIRFLGIFSSNQDEFFRVRVAMLKKLCLMNRKAKKIRTEDPEELMKKVQEVVHAQRKRSEQVYSDLFLELKENGISILKWDQLDEDQNRFVMDYFFSRVRPQIFPMIIDIRGEFPYLKDSTLYLAVELGRQNKPEKNRYSIIEIPDRTLPRFVRLPGNSGKTDIILIDEIVRAGLPSIFSVHKFDRFHAWNFKVTRDAELEIDEDDISVSYLNKITMGLERRKEGELIRFVYDHKMPDKMRELFIKKTRMHRLDTLSSGGRYHRLRDLLTFPEIAGLETTPLNTPVRHSSIDQKKRIFSSIKKRDVLLYFPYHSFSTVIDLLRDASIDPSVESIKVTLYRVARFSSIANALINAQRNGKDVTVHLELKARFDEENNIYWANKMKEEGIKIFFGVRDLKVHSKLCIITRRENGKPVRYCSIGTGNMNEDTARLYTDCILLTSDQEICEEVNNIFKFLERKINFNKDFRHLLISPVNIRQRLTELIDFETAEAEAGRESWIWLKLNNFADTELARKCYQASCAGVDIRIICRSRFTIQTGIPGLSENIKAISIVDKYLEHSRFFIFCHEGKELTFIGSADWQTRNLDYRIEVTCPIYRKKLKTQLKDIFEIQWKDNVKARILNPQLDNILVSPENGRPPVRSQDEVYKYLLEENSN